MVVHCKKEPYDVYIGRPSRWGNKFVIGKDGSRADVIRKYEEWITSPEQEELLLQVGELYDKRLGCYCAPYPCHGDVLERLADLMHSITR